MQRDDDIGHLLDFLNGVIRLGQVDMHTGCNGRPGGRKIFIVAAKPRYDGFAFGCVDSDRLPADRMPG
jgi:hypothetical protein